MKILRDNNHAFGLILAAIGLFVFSMIFKYLVVFGFRVVSLEKVFVADFIFQAIISGLLILTALWCFHRLFDLPTRPDFKSFLKYVIIPWTVLTLTYYFYTFGFSGGVPDIDFFAQRLVSLLIFGGLYFWRYAETENEKEEIA